MSDGAEGTVGWLQRWSLLSGLTLIALALQAVTGILMALSYQPTPDHAYSSVYYISTVIPYGWAVRTVHAWGAQLMIGLVAAHALRAFVTASYKRQREGDWVLGVLALVVTLAMAFTGHLLPWDQKAYWSTAAAFRLARQAPLIGTWLVDGVFGGTVPGASTLTRFYAAHLALLPAVLAGLLLTHVWITRRQAASEAHAGPEGSRLTATAAVLLLCLYTVLAMFVPASLGVKADPSAAPAVVKPEWYFLSLYALALYVPPAIAATAPYVLGVLFTLLPLLDRGPSRRARDRVLTLTLGSGVIAAIAVFSLVGAFR